MLYTQRHYLGSSTSYPIGTVFTNRIQLSKTRQYASLPIHSAMDYLQVYLGIWVNWTYGLIYGATLTLSQRGGAILTAAIAVFITSTGSRLWKLTSFVIHQLRSSRQPQDGLFWQQQVIFRNALSAEDSAWSFLKQHRYWKGHVPQRNIRTIPWALFGFTYAILLAVAALFSSEITNTTGSNRLLQPLTCGYLEPNFSASQSEIDRSVVQNVATKVQQAASYARICYNSSSASSASLSPETCGALPNSNLTWASDQNASCPFDRGVCLFSDTAAFSMTSAKLDSHEHLGINARSQDRLTLQKTATCAPLNTTGYYAMVNGTDLNPEIYTDPNQEFYILNVGPLVLNSTSGEKQNYTVQYDTHLVISDIGYTTFAFIAIAGFENLWEPISSLSRVDADVSLIGIAANSLLFDAPCWDPIFRATDPITDSSDTVYAFDGYVTFIACAEQYQICNPVNSKCTALGGTSQLDANASSLDMNPRQNATFYRLSSSTQWSGLYYQVDVRGSNALIAQESVITQNLEQFPLPNGQWIVEVQGWFESGLAMIQQDVQSYPIGRLSAVSAGMQIIEPVTIEEKDMCKNQISRFARGNTVSFSVLGLCLTTVIGGLMILLSFAVEPLTERIAFSRGRGKVFSRYISWVLDDHLQLFRLVTQLSGMIKWTGTMSSIPITTRYGTKFGGWGSVNKEHVWLRDDAEPGMSLENSGTVSSPLLTGEQLGEGRTGDESENS